MAGKNTVGNLAVIISGNAAPYIQSLNQAKQVTGQFANQITNIHEKGGNSGGGGGMLQGLIGGAAAGGVMSLANAATGVITSLASATLNAGKSAISAAMDYEQLAASFKVMTGSATAGKKLLGDIEKFAVATPFDSAGLAEISKSFLGRGIKEDQIIPTLKVLGDLAGGDVEILKRLALQYSQVMGKGKLQGQELAIFGELGIGAKDFAQTLGKTESEFYGLMEQGRVSAAVVSETFNRLTSDGGRFSGNMAEGAKTVKGSWANLSETVAIEARKAGTVFLEEFDVANTIRAVSDEFGKMGLTAENLRPYFSQAKDAGIELFAILKGGAETILPILRDEFKAMGGGEGLTFQSFLTKTTDLVFNLTYALAKLIETVSEARKAIDDSSGGSIYQFATMGAGDYFFAGKGGKGDPASQTGLAATFAENYRKSLEQARAALAGGADSAKRAADELGKIAKIKIDLAVPPADVADFASKLKASMASGISPLEKFREDMRLVNQGGIFGLLNKQQRDQGMVQAFDELTKGMGQFTTKLPASMLKGTQAAQSVINRELYRNNNPQKRIENILDQANRIHRLNEQHTKDTAEALKKLQIQGVGF